MTGKIYSSERQIFINKVKTIVLIMFLTGLMIFAFGYVGNFFGYLEQGIVAGFLVATIMIPVQLYQAKNTIITITHGRMVNPDIQKDKELLTVVEGLSGVAGLSRVPSVYILPSAIPNAFASGLTEKSAIVGVTQGLLNIMDQNELEGVLAHEISHIKHRDILISQLIASISAALMLLTFYMPLAVIQADGGQNLNSRRNSSNNNNGGGNLIAFLFMIIAAPIAKLISFLIERSASRKREYAADACAAIFCGSGAGIANALEKIKKYKLKSDNEINSLGGNRFRSMYIHFPSKTSMFSTHPPIEKRIRILRNMY